MSLDTSMTPQEAHDTLQRLRKEFAAICESHRNMRPNDLRSHIYIKTIKGAGNEKILSLEFKESIRADPKNFSVVKWIKNIFNRTFYKKYYVLKPNSLTTQQLKSLQEALLKVPQEQRTQDMYSTVKVLNHILKYVRGAKIADCHGNMDKERPINELFQSLVLPLPAREEAREEEAREEEAREEEARVREDIAAASQLQPTPPLEPEPVVATPSAIQPPASSQLPIAAAPSSEASLAPTTQPPAQSEFAATIVAPIEKASPAMPEPADTIKPDSVSEPQAFAKPQEPEPLKPVLVEPEVVVKQVTFDEACRNVYDENSEVFEALGITLEAIREKNAPELMRVIKEKIEPELEKFAAMDTKTVPTYRGWGSKQETTEYGVSGSLLRGVYADVYNELLRMVENPQETFRKDSDDWLVKVDRLAKLVFYERQMLRAYETQDPEAQRQEAQRMVYAMMLQNLVRKTESFLHLTDREDKMLIQDLYKTVHLTSKESLSSPQQLQNLTIYNADLELDALKKAILTKSWATSGEDSWVNKIEQPPIMILPLVELLKELKTYRQKIAPSDNISYQIQAIAMQPALAYKDFPSEAQYIRNQVFLAAKQADPANRARAAQQKADEFKQKPFHPEELLDCIKKIGVIKSLDTRDIETCLQEILDKKWEASATGIYLQNRQRDIHDEIRRLRQGNWIPVELEAECHVYVDIGKWQEVKRVILTALLQQNLGVSAYVAHLMYDTLLKHHDMQVWARAIQAAKKADKGGAYKALREVVGSSAGS